MKKMLTVLTTVVLGSNTGLLVPRTIDQVQKWDGIEDNPISVQTMPKHNNLLKDNTKQLTAGFIRSIITMINHNTVLKNLEIKVTSIEDSEVSAKSQIRSKFMSVLRNYGIDFNHLVFDFKLTDFAPPQELSAKEIVPGSINARIGIRNTMEKEFLWSNIFLVKILFPPIIQEPKAENIVINSKYNDKGFSDGLAYNDILYFVNDTRVFSYDQKSTNVELIMQLENRIITNGVAYNNNLYFAADDCYVYEYNLINHHVNKIFKANNLIKSNGIVVNNKLYFGSDDYSLYEYDAKTSAGKIVLTAESEIRHSGTVYNNKLYFGTENNDFYAYDTIEDKTTSWKRTNEESTVSDSGVLVGDAIYFTANLKNKSSIYKLDLIKKVIWTWDFVSDINTWFRMGSIMSLKNKLYLFMTLDGYEFTQIYEFNHERLIRFASVDHLSGSTAYLKGIIYNNAIYMAYSTKIYKFDVEKRTSKPVFDINGWSWIRIPEFTNRGVLLNDKIYYSTAIDGILEYDLKNNF